MASCRAASRSTPAVSITLRATTSGSSAAERCATDPSGEPCASIPTASITASVPRPSVRSRMTSPRSASTAEKSMTSMPRAATRDSRSGTRSTPITRYPRWAATRHAMSPIGPRPSTVTEPPSGTAAYSTACHAVGSTSERYRNR
ncbi:Uncharacterised protein [Mycobacteroides abscessus subsp. abscessus]|nr:Uncharacterised protein [Mycobacteroides abscessus subsp. abscessus]